MKKIYEIDGEFDYYHFYERINRFVVKTEEGKLCHLHDPGRLNEILLKGAEVQTLKKNTGLGCEILSVKGNDGWIFINSRFHSKIAQVLISGGFINDNFKIKKMEVKYGESRLDFLLDFNGNDYYLEVKGCTLMEGNVAKFPDAPTKRGSRHLNELVKIKRYGGYSGVMFLIFRNADYFMPNRERDENFYFSLKRAHENGVDIFPVKLLYSGKDFYFAGKVPLKF